MIRLRTRTKFLRVIAAVPVALALLAGGFSARPAYAAEPDSGVSTSARYIVDGDELNIHITWVKVDADLENNPDFIHGIQQFQADSHAPPITFFSEEEVRSPSAESNSRLSKIRKIFQNNGASTDGFRIPRKTVRGIGKRFAEFIVKPTRDEIYVGLVEGAWRGITSGFVWFSQSGVSTPVAAGLTAFQTMLTTTQAVYASSLDRMFSKTAEEGVTAHPVTQFIRRQGWGLALTETLRFLSGTTATAASVFSLHGQAQIFSYLLTVGTGDALYSASKLKAFANDAKVATRLNLFSYFLLAPITLMSLSGMGGHVLLDVGFYQVTESTLAVLGAYGALTTAVRAFPDQVSKLMHAPDSFLDKMRVLFGRGKLHHCSDLLNSPG